MQVSNKPFLDVFAKYKDSKGRQAKLKAPAELEFFLEAVLQVSHTAALICLCSMLVIFVWHLVSDSACSQNFSMCGSALRDRVQLPLPPAPEFVRVRWNASLSSPAVTAALQYYNTG